MDRQLIAEFQKLYFSKNQMRRRVYNGEDLNLIWDEIVKERKENCTELTAINNKKNIKWYNITNDISESINYIDSNIDNEIMNYLSLRNRSKIIEELIISEASSSFEVNSSKINRKVLEKILFDIENGKLKEENKELLNLYYILKDISVGKFELKQSYVVDVYTRLFNEHVIEDTSDKESIYSESYNEKVLYNLIDEINEDKNTSPIIKAAILHFYIIDTAIFTKWNDVMARLLSYGYLISHGYGILMYTSPSMVLLEERKKYLMAIENSKVHDGDITYFIKYYTSAIKSSLERFNKQMSLKYGKKIIKELIDRKNINLESRHIKFINTVIASEKGAVTIYDYKEKANVSYETARTDLNYLITLGFFKIGKVGKKYEYYINDISTIIESFEE